MANFNRDEKRVLALLREMWEEVDERAQALGINAEAVIREALHTYFDLVGPAPTGISDCETTGE